jgi:hypothetical protein
MWQPIQSAPFEAEIELAVIDREGPHALVFPLPPGVAGLAESRNRRENSGPSHALAAVGPGGSGTTVSARPTRDIVYRLWSILRVVPAKRALSDALTN